MLPIVEVKWLDAYISTCDLDLKKAKKAKPIERHTIGYLVSESDDCIVLCTDYFPGKKRVKEVSAVMVIPADWIQEKWELISV